MVFIVKCAYCIIFQECVCMLLLLLLLRFFRPIRMRLVRCALRAFYLTTVIFLLKELTGCANADTRCSLVFSEQHTLYERSERPNVKLDLIKNGKSLNEIWTKLTEPHPTCFSTVPIAGPIVPVFGFCISIFFIFFLLLFVRFVSFCFVRLVQWQWLLWLFESSVRTYMINLNQGTQCTLRIPANIFFRFNNMKYIISIILFRFVSVCTSVNDINTSWSSLQRFSCSCFIFSFSLSVSLSVWFWFFVSSHLCLLFLAPLSH